MEKFDKFEGKKINWKISRLRENQNSSILSLLNQQNVDKLDEDIANKLIKSWNIGVLAKNLFKFEKLSNDIAKKLIRNWYLEDLAKNLSSFQWLDKNTAKIISNFWWF